MAPTPIWCPRLAHHGGALDESAAAAATFGKPKPDVARPAPRRTSPNTRAPTPASREALLCSTGAFDVPDTFPVVRADLKDSMIINVGPSIEGEERCQDTIIDRHHKAPRGSSEGKAGAELHMRAAGCSGAERARPRCRWSGKRPPGRRSASSSSPSRSSMHSTARTSPRRRPCDRLVAAARWGGAPR